MQSYDQWKNLFLSTSETRTYDNIRKIKTSKGDDYTTGCLLNYLCFKEYYKMIAIDLRKQQSLDANPKEIKQFNCTGILDLEATKYSIIEEAKESSLDFLQETVGYCKFNLVNIT